MLALLAATLLSASDSLVVTPAWLGAHRNTPGLVILDVSMSRQSYDEGHVPGARWLSAHDVIEAGPPGAELPTVAKLTAVLGRLGVTAQSRIIYYGDTWMSPRLFLALDYIGLGDHAALLDGGLDAWRAAGFPVSKETPTWRPTSLTAVAHPDIVVSAEWLFRKLNDATLALVDGRSSGEYTATKFSEQLPRYGHIPGALNLPWEQTYTDGAAALEGRQSPLQPVATLRQLVESVGMRPGALMVTYCTVGYRAAHLYFIARYLGLHPLIYDGSMSEWSRKAAFPIVTGPSPR